MIPLSTTAFYCCGVRMEDSEREPSICRDLHAHRFMDERGLEVFTPFRLARTSR